MLIDEGKETLSCPVDGKGFLMESLAVLPE